MRIRLFDFYFEYSQRHTEHTHTSFLTRPCSSVNEFTPFICTSLLLAGCLARLLMLISLLFSNNTLTLLVFSVLSHQPVSLLTKLLTLFCHDPLMKSTSLIMRGHRICPCMFRQGQTPL